jgi:hypothetical protein
MMERTITDAIDCACDMAYISRIIYALADSHLPSRVTRTGGRSTVARHDVIEKNPRGPRANC